MATKNDLPLYKCPRYSKCSVNNCPLHPVYPHILVCPEDKELKCGVAKSIRVRISAEFPGMLKMGGLTTREHAAKQKWDSLSPDEQAIRKNKMVNVRSHIAAGKQDTELPQQLYVPVRD